MNDRDRLIACFRHAVEAALPGPAVARALGEEDDGRAAPVILSVGKAAVPMAEAAVDHLSRQERRAADGLVVAPEPAGFQALPVIAGEHPVPGAGSRRAALAIARLCQRVPAATPVWCLLSGGTTSLIGGPDEGIGEEDLDAAWRVLLTSGLDITAMNAVRKRLTRWGGGKLARALAHTTVLQLIVSDVIADDLPSIGSGPLVPDPLRAADVVAALRRHGAWDHLPAALRERLEAMADGRLPDTPAAGDPAFRQVRSRIIVSNRMAMEAAAEAAGRAGWEPCPVEDPLEGEAVEAAERIVEAMRARDRGARPALLIYGGETTVTIPPGAGGLGGRAQELALAAARLLAMTPRDAGVLLAAGTDGRDGPTDAAGAVVDRETWRRIARAGVDPAAALAGHDAHPALDAAGALLRTGPTGTNVMDLVLALVPAA